MTLYLWPLYITLRSRITEKKVYNLSTPFYRVGESGVTPGVRGENTLFRTVTDQQVISNKNEICNQMMNKKRRSVGITGKYYIGKKEFAILNDVY